ncbi:MAG: SDR family oxidoreductase [Fimbriimonadaceae bacterium]|nr:SDR family oxidoreductase [Alphaproteobacteria bacterium]
MNHLLIFGVGYSALEVAKYYLGQGWRVTGTVREAEKAAALNDLGIAAIRIDASIPSDAVRTAMRTATHLLISIPPGDVGDPIAKTYGKDIISGAPLLKWIGYFSSLGVYGNHDGKWVDEITPLTPSTGRGERRVVAETEWRELAKDTGIPLTIFRLAGIYGPGRCAIDGVKAGTARRIIKPGQVFNRIHVADIVQVVAAAIERDPKAVEVYNVCDDEPAAPADVVEFAANLIGVAPPPAIPIDEAGLSPMGMSFYGEVKRVRNAKIKDRLGVSLLFPDYRVGLKTISLDT